MITVDADTTKWIEREQVLLWDALDNELRRSWPLGCWSIAAANTACRIIGAARLVGASRAGEIPWRLVASGIYARVLQIAGIEPVGMPSDEAEWRRSEALMAEYGGDRATASRAVRRSLESLAEPLEVEYLLRNV